MRAFLRAFSRVRRAPDTKLGMTYRTLAGAMLSASLASFTALACSSSSGPDITNVGGSTAGAGGHPAMTGSAGSSSIAGTSSTGGASGGATGSAGSSTVATGGGGAGGAAAGAGGMTSAAGAAGSAGATGKHPTGPSAGCNMDAPAGDSATSFIQHNITVTEPLDPAAIAADPANAGQPYDWTHRNYYLRLPKNYDKTKPYVLDIGGSGCGGDDTVGKEGGYPTLSNGQTQEIQVALSYLASSKNGACFADDFVDPPDLEYFDAVLADLEAKYCIDRSNIFMHGYSSGAWETYMLGCARANVIRGIGTAQGGMRNHRPMCTGPVAAILTAGEPPNDNPIGPLMPDDPVAKQLDSLGSAPARDDILKRNGCTSSSSKPWDPMYNECVQYTDCPAAYPVVWCAMATLGHGYPSGLANDGFWKFWTALPPAP